MSNDNHLHRAHQLSAQASILARPTDADPESLRKALEAYREATELFEMASEGSDSVTKQTLRMLVLQHRKLTRDLERRISSTTAPLSPIPPIRRSSLSPSASEVGLARPRSSTPTGASAGSTRRSSLTTANSPSSTTLARVGSGGANPGVGLAAGRGGALGGPSAVHATAAPRSVPPFALRPVGSPSHPNAPGGGYDPSFSHGPGPVPPQPFAAGPMGASGGPGSPRSPLYSSSSSSEPATEESYLFPGAVPDTLDPFSRFWGMLENMLDDISFPKALTTAPLGPVPMAPLPRTPVQSERQHGEKAKKVKSSPKEGKDRPPSPTESFYVVSRDKDIARGKEAPPPGSVRKSSPSAKTNEELLLENESLRASLDALAKHNHAVELANRELTQRAEERDKLVRSVVSGVRKEAKKVRHDQEVMRSQMLASVAGQPGGQQISPQAVQAQNALRKRVADLESEVETLKDDNNKLRGQLDKFKEKWDKLKAKKEAKQAANARASPWNTEPNSSHH